MISEHIIDPILCGCALAFVLACSWYGCDVLRGIIDSRRAYKNHIIAEKQRNEDEQRFKEVEEFISLSKWTKEERKRLL